MQIILLSSTQRKSATGIAWTGQKEPCPPGETPLSDSKQRGHKQTAEPTEESACHLNGNLSEHLWGNTQGLPPAEPLHRSGCKDLEGGAPGRGGQAPALRRHLAGCIAVYLSP